MDILSTRNISKRYENFNLNHLNLNLKEGELFGFLGPNGSGKTTVVKILTGQLKPTTGKVNLLGTDVINNPVNARKSIGIIPEQENPSSFLTTYEYLKFVCKVREMSVEMSDKKINEWMKFLEFEENKNSLIKNLSRGTKQKVLITQAFIHEPKLVFIDEPLINLDPIMQKKFKDFLLKYVKKGNSIFLSTHVLSIAQEICTSIGIIKNGKIIFQGNLKEIKKKKKNLEAYFIDIIKKNV